MALYHGRLWHCDGCKKPHPLSRYIEAESPREGSWCGASIKRAIKDRRNVDFPAHLLDSFRREMGLAT